MHEESLSEYAVIREKLPARRAYLLHLINDEEYELVGVVNFETGIFDTEVDDVPELEMDDYPFLYTVNNTDWYCHEEDYEAMVEKYASESVKEMLGKIDIK